jgi:hypothetical protein
VQAVRVQDRQQVIVAGLLVHQGLDGKGDHAIPSEWATRTVAGHLGGYSNSPRVAALHL